MPIELRTVWTCSSNRYFSVDVIGSTGNTYTVHWGLLEESRSEETGNSYGWECTCKGFHFRGHCRHIDEIKSQRCGWNEKFDPDITPEIHENGKMECPKCGGPVFSVKVLA